MLKMILKDLRLSPLRSILTRAAKALAELEKAFDMPYMGTDRCDDATRKYLRDNIDKAKLGDPSGFTECIQANYAD